MNCLQIANLFLNSCRLHKPCFKNIKKELLFLNSLLSFRYAGYTAKLVPQPQVLLALGLLNVKPRLFNPPCQSTSIPIR